MSKKKQEIKLTKYETENIRYDDNYYLEFSDKAYALGYVPVTRTGRLIGRKDTFFLFSLDKKGYTIWTKTHDVKQAEFSFYNAPVREYWQETFNIIKNGNGNNSKNVQDRKVKTRKDRIKDDVVLNAILSVDIRLKDNDDDLTVAAKQSLSKVRRKDFEVVLLPDKYGGDF